MWEERFGREEFIYGEAPNEYFKRELDKLKAGKILLPLEGEGRNAVYAAKKGWQVHAFDYAENGKIKTEQLANREGVSIDQYWVTDAESFSPEAEAYDAIALIYSHVPPEIRADFHQKMIKALKPGGKVIFEGFSKEQLDYDSGGPPREDYLFSLDEVKKDFSELTFEYLEKEVVYLQEGRFHLGEGSVIRMTGVKEK